MRFFFLEQKKLQHKLFSVNFFGNQRDRGYDPCYTVKQ